MLKGTSSAQVITKRWEGRCWRCHCFNIYNQSFKFRVITNHYLPVTTWTVTSFVTRVLPPKGNAFKDNFNPWMNCIPLKMRCLPCTTVYLTQTMISITRSEYEMTSSRATTSQCFSDGSQLDAEARIWSIYMHPRDPSAALSMTHMMWLHHDISCIYIYKSNTITKNHPHKHIIHIGISDTNHPGSGSIFAYFLPGQKPPQNHRTSVESLPLIPCIALSELPQNLFHRCTTFTFLGWFHRASKTQFLRGWFGGNWSCWKK